MTAQPNDICHVGVEQTPLLPFRAVASWYLCAEAAFAEQLEHLGRGHVEVDLCSKTNNPN